MKDESRRIKNLVRLGVKRPNNNLQTFKRSNVYTEMGEAHSSKNPNLHNLLVYDFDKYYYRKH